MVRVLKRCQSVRFKNMRSSALLNLRKLLPLLLVLCLLSHETLAQKKNHPRIVGGIPTRIQNVQYLVNLRQDGRFICGGALVRRNFVVTAAHCIKGVRPGRLTVVGGVTDLSQAGVRRKVIKVMRPKSFNSRTFNMDVAVLKLAADLTGPQIRTIDLCNSNWRPGQSVKVSGWGLTAENSRTRPNRVHTANLPIIAKGRCARLYRQAGQALTRTMFCASLPGRKDSCTGDSGGPVVFNNQLCGVVSWGIGCARSGFPGVYTNIRAAKNFIIKCLKD